ncbi:MAG: hypothetical protein JWO38_4036 [Gemmataceae bacterium]|nr:hypothetical protein [Gemmataceae bacterium]
MTTEEQIREVYAYFGLAVYCGQVLEHGIVNAMVVLRLPRRDRFTKGDIDAFMDQQFENTLGKLIKNLRAELALPTDLEGLLGQALKTRNWLCHEYFRERAIEFMTAAGRDKMLAELADAGELLNRADKRLSAVVQPLADRYGLTEEKMQVEYQALCREHGISARSG